MIIAGLETQDSAFFAITSPDIELKQSVLNEDILSFSFEEEMGRYSMGSLVVNDPNHYYSRVLRMGAKLEISFGYTSPDISVQAGILQNKNPSQLSGGLARTGINAYIMNPSGKAGSDGKVIFNCNFYGSEMLASKKYRTHIGMTKKVLVQNLLEELGIKSYYINFTREVEILNKNTQIMQRETNYKLLLRFAREWRCIFRISNDSSGNLSAVFISPQYIGQTEIGKLMSGTIGGDSIYLEYKEGVSNVMEYSWKNHQSSSGAGDNVRIVTGADGKPTFIRYIAKGDSVQAYKFRPDRVEKRLRKAGNFISRISLLKSYLNAKSFEEVKWAFDPVTIKTAPQGLGYSMQAKILGVPLMSAPLKVLFGEGFPDWFSPEKPKTHIVNYYARKVSHTIDQNGYKMDLDIVDGFTLTGGSLL